MTFLDTTCGDNDAETRTRRTEAMAYMTIEPYQGFAIESGEDPPGPLRRHVRRWFEARSGTENFALSVFLTPGFPIDGDRQNLAFDYGLHWMHGLIDLARYGKGQIHELSLTSEWDPLFGEHTVTEEDLRREILLALKRMLNRQAQVSEILFLDVEGIACVLGIRSDRVKGSLAELETEGLVEEYQATFSHGLTEGACRISGAGLKSLRELERELKGFRLVFLEDIDSFAKVKDVPESAVRQHLEDGLLQSPEEQVKEAIKAILGEDFEFKDWGGEKSDVFTTRVRLGGQRTPTAFLLKGPAVGKVLYPKSLGARGDQDQRLFQEPAELFVLQFNGKIDSSVHHRLRTEAERRGASGKRTLLCLVDGTDTARLLQAYGFI